MGRCRMFVSVLVALAVNVGIQPATAQDLLKVAAGQRGNWDTTIAEVGQRAGIFKKHGWCKSCGRRAAARRSRR